MGLEEAEEHLDVVMQGGTLCALNSNHAGDLLVLILQATTNLNEPHGAHLL
jgi:hypothetical protein